MLRLRCFHILFSLYYSAVNDVKPKTLQIIGLALFVVSTVLFLFCSVTLQELALETQQEHRDIDRVMQLNQFSGFSFMSGIFITSTGYILVVLGNEKRKEQKRNA